MDPSKVCGFDKIQVSGTFNDETVLSKDYQDPVNFYEDLHRPVVEAVLSDAEDLRVSNGVGAYDAMDTEKTPKLRRLNELWQQNLTADMTIYLEINEGKNGSETEKYEFNLIPRSDKQPEDAEKCFSFVEASYMPQYNETTSDSAFADNPKKLALRFAHRYDRDFLEQNFGKGVAESEHEIDLLTAFQRNGGVLDQIRRSDIDFGPVFRPEMRIFPSSYDSDIPIVEETVPYAARYVTDRPKEGGLDEPDIDAAARHIGSSLSLGLSARHERVADEIFGEYTSDFGFQIVNIDPEGVRYVPEDEDELEEDQNLFVQQIKPIGDGTSHHRIDEKAEDIIRRARDSTKNWREVVGTQLPDDWEKSMPDENFIQDL